MAKRSNPMMRRARDENMLKKRREVTRFSRGLVLVSATRRRRLQGQLLLQSLGSATTLRYALRLKTCKYSKRPRA